MKIVVIGGTGLIGSKVVGKLREQGHEAVAASPDTGVNTITGEGLALALMDASVVVDVSNSPSLEPAAALAFFETSTHNLLAAEVAAGVGHHVALSIVGAERLPESGYIRAKIAQERLIEESSVPYSLVRATQFFEFVKGIAAAATDGDTVRLAPVLVQPVAADDVAGVVCSVALGRPVNRTVEVAGPERMRFDALIQRGLRAHGDPRKVVADPHARYFGAELSERTLVAGDDARTGKTTFEDWLRQPTHERAGLAPAERGAHMTTIKTKDGASIFYKDWGEGQPVVFSHGWPLNGDAWDEQLFFLASRGYRAIAHDRRGHGRSSQTWRGNDMNTYADDLAQLIEQLDLKKAVLVGHSTGGGEVTRYIGRHGTRRVAKAALIGAVPPLLLKSEANPEGLPLALFDGLRAGIASDRSQFYKEFAVPFYGANRPESKVSQALRDQFWLQCMQVGLKGALDCVKAFSETDFTEDLKKFDVPTLILHGEDDQIVPIALSAMRSSKLVKNATLKVYPGAPHALTATHQEQFNADLLAFIKA